MDVETNIVLAAMRRYVGPLGFVNSRETRATAEREVQHLAIKTPSVASEGQEPVGRQPAEDRRRRNGSRAIPTS